MRRQIEQRRDGAKFKHRHDEDQGFVDQHGVFMSREKPSSWRTRTQIINPDGLGHGRRLEALQRGPADERRRQRPRARPQGQRHHRGHRRAGDWWTSAQLTLLWLGDGSGLARVRADVGLPNWKADTRAADWSLDARDWRRSRPPMNVAQPPADPVARAYWHLEIGYPRPTTTSRASLAAPTTTARIQRTWPANAPAPAAMERYILPCRLHGEGTTCTNVAQCWATPARRAPAPHLAVDRLREGAEHHRRRNLPHTAPLWDRVKSLDFQW